MKVIVQVSDPTGCINPTSSICVTDVTLGNGQDNGTLVFVPSGSAPGSADGPCLTENGTFTVYLLDTDSCTVNLLVHFSIDGGPVQITPLKSDNIPSGNANAEFCVPPA
ncbi:hypothetical protein [Oryzobacter telluris]|uniref:hypothetical protein n=1 Tax=Oryzobacter telluris TaxID=3149179 RepID=UPI00370DDE88